jgi:hypothetical protein
MKNQVTYTEPMVKIIEEESKNHPKNKKEGFRIAAKRIEEEIGEKNVTAEKVSTYFYTHLNKRKASKRASTKSSTTNQSTKSSTKSKRGQTKATTRSSANGVPTKLELMRQMAQNISKAEKAELIQEWYSEL